MLAATLGATDVPSESSALLQEPPVPKDQTGHEACR